MKIGALRQTQLPVSSAGRGRCVCLLRLADFRGAGRCPLAKTGALRQTQLPVSSTGCGRCVCLLRLANFPGGPQSALVKIGALLRVAVAQICGADRSPLAKSRPRSSCAWPIFAARGGARLRKPERCAKHSSLFRPQDAVAVFAPAPLRLFLPQAAPQLRSQLHLAVSAAGSARLSCPPSGGVSL